MKIHIVQKGDTLWEIAQMYGVDFNELKEVNSQISSPDMIMPGMKIKIPSSSKQVKQKETQVKEHKQHVKEEKKPAKEEKKPVKEQPKSPKPLSVKEDDHMKPSKVKPEMPQMPSMPPMMQLPMMEQEMNQYTTINIPKQEKHHHKEKITKENKMKSEPEMPQMQPSHMPMHYYPMPMIPVCCNVMPCCCCQHQHHMYEPMPHHMNKGDCCGHNHMEQPNYHPNNMNMPPLITKPYEQPSSTMPKHEKYEGHKDGIYSYSQPKHPSMHHQMNNEHHNSFVHQSQPYPPFYRGEPEAPHNPTPPDFPAMSAHGMGEEDPNSN